MNKTNYVGESSAAASKRRRIQFLDQPQSTTNVTNDLNFSPPSPMSFQDEEVKEVTVHDQLISSLIPQQKFIIDYHVIYS